MTEEQSRTDGAPAFTPVAPEERIPLLDVLRGFALLARFRFGPLEWLWRAATYGKLPRMALGARKPPEASSHAPPASETLGA